MLSTKDSALASMLLQIRKIESPHGLRVEVTVNGPNLEADTRRCRTLKDELSAGENAMREERRSFVKKDEVHVRSLEEIHHFRYRLQSVLEWIVPHYAVCDENRDVDIAVRARSAGDYGAKQVTRLNFSSGLEIGSQHVLDGANIPQRHAELYPKEALSALMAYCSVSSEIPPTPGYCEPVRNPA